MSRRFLKSSVVSFVSFVLLYYSAAWAVLRCLHDEDHPALPVEIIETGACAEVSYAQFPNRGPENLECMGFNYHAESLGGSSSSPQLPRWAARIISHVTDFSILDGIAAGSTRGLSLRDVLDQFANPVFFLDLPRYLSLSVLRI